MKKILIIITVSCTLLLISSLSQSEALAATVNEVNVVMRPMYTNVISFNNYINIINGNEVNVESNLSYHNADEARIVVYLEQYINGNWVVLQGWSNSGSDLYLYVNGSRIVSTGSQCRMRAYGYVYDGGKIIETASFTSATVSN
ncbi:MAG: hypothetical protein K0S76_2238 [Herbinix sp.]|jgi:hypothetical protein|nr:hypothetical protein [Herbinix sp.]